MVFVTRRLIIPSAILAASLLLMVIWSQLYDPQLLHQLFGHNPATAHTAAGIHHATPRHHPGATPATHSPDRGAARSDGPLAGALDAVVSAVKTAALLLAAITGVVVACRAIGRGRRSRPAVAPVCAELQLGRDDHAAPYEVSKIFDGLAGALRPSPLRHLLFGADTIALKIIADPTTRTVRFVVQARPDRHRLIAARLAATYPDVQMHPVDLHALEIAGLADVLLPSASAVARLRGGPVDTVGVDVVRLKKARRWLWTLATTKDYEHSPIEALVKVMDGIGVPAMTDLALTPALPLFERYAGRAVRRREHRMRLEGSFSPNDPGVESVVAQKHLKGAVESVGRALWRFDYRILVPRGDGARAREIAGIIQETRGENHLRVRVMRARRRLYASRSLRAIPPALPSLYTGIVSSAELASLWHLPTLRLKGVPLRRTAAREIPAGSAISRDPKHAILRDTHGPLGIRWADLRFGWMLLGAPGSGKTAALARYVLSIAKDLTRALLIVDPKEDFARLCLSLIPRGREVIYLDLGRPRYGLNILTAGNLSPEIRADIFIAVIRELFGEQAVGPRTDMLLRCATIAVCTVEQVPTLQHISRMLDPDDAGYRNWVIRELGHHHEIDFVRDYWQRVYPAAIAANPRFIAEAVAAPQNKLARFLASPSMNLLMTHPVQLDLEQLITQRQVLIINGSKGAVGEDNANLFCSMFVLLVQKLLHQQQRKNEADRVRVALVIDEAHNVFTPSFATMLSEGRSGGLEVAAAFQYTGQILDERVKAGIKSLLQNISIFRLREFEDARNAAALAMEIFTDNLRGEPEDQRRVRLDPMDIINQPNHRCVNLWLSDGAPQPAFTANTLPTEPILQDPAAIQRRQRHTRQQLLRGDHPHDHDRYIQPPLVWSIDTPVIARFREIHVDLDAWEDRPPAPAIECLAVKLTAARSAAGAKAFACTPCDSQGRRWQTTLPEDPGQPGWLPEGEYRVEVLCWTVREQQPTIWHPTTANAEGQPEALTIVLSEEPLRRTSTSAEAAA